jgi:16S rRNA (cytosine967-C5)-methyltransferase
MPVSPARKITFDVLLRVESESAYASDVLHSALGADVKTVDAALATELTLGVLRWRRLLDFLLERQLKKPVARLDLAVAIALRVGLYQLRFLENIPARAAVNESVELVKRARKSSAAPLVNAVLRRAAAEAESSAENFVSPNLPRAERLAILHSHPTWLVERWLARFGEPAAVALLEANNRAPRLTFAVADLAHGEEIIQELESSGLRTERGRLLNSAFAASGGSLARTAAFRAGQISIQDEASQAVPLLLGVCAGDRVLDLCAAPGGKTAVLARAAGPRALVVAADLHEHRLRAMHSQLTRLGLAGVHLIALDGAQPLPFAARFDRMLVDAPCSGTGTLARHPEIRWRLRQEQLTELHTLQTQLLRNALAHLAPGGRLVYSTCSIEAEENESVVAEVLNERASVRLAAPSEAQTALAPHLAPGLDAASFFALDGFFRTSPAAHASDGFFAAALEIAG